MYNEDLLPIPQTVLTRLRLEDAIESEAASWQTLLPKTPGWPEVVADKQAFAHWLAAQLQAGLAASPQVVASVRKSSHGIRPVPVWGLAERVAYKALTAFILRNTTPPDRSPAAYLEFVGAPLAHARELEPEQDALFFIGSSTIQYVVKSDVNAFYEYIDHDVLRSELISITGEYDAVDCLMSLMGETQARSYGLPQMFESSDQLSDLHIDIAHRELLRRGWAAWRFNDDFRIAASSFSDALRAIEDLATALRRIGLTLSDHKTTTPKFWKYASDNFDLSVDVGLPAELASHIPEDFVGDYTEGVGEEDPAWAVDLLTSVYVGPKDDDDDDDDDDAGAIDLTDLGGTGFRRLRRALSRLERDPNVAVLNELPMIVSFVPALTPWVLRLVAAAKAVEHEEAAGAILRLVREVAMTDWQRVWVLRAIGDLGLLEPTGPGDPPFLAEWVLRIGRENPSTLVAAESALALSTAGLLEFSALESGLANSPDALATWYLTAFRKEHAFGVVSDRVLDAVRGAGGVAASVLRQ